MKKGCVFNGIILLIIGALIGAGLMYYMGVCKTTATRIQLGNTGAGITVTKTGDAN